VIADGQSIPAIAFVSNPITVATIAILVDIAGASTGCTIGCMTTLARFPFGRILLHLLAMRGDGRLRFHVTGISRKLPWVTEALTLCTRLRTRLIGGLVLYIAQPIRNHGLATIVDPQALAAILDRGDVLLTEGNTRVAALVKRVTRSTWSHVSMYVGPLEEGPDPRCIVEADIAAGVRSIRLSELNAVHVRVLRPTGLNDMRRRQLADWVVSRIGSGYDLAHAWALGRSLLRLPASTRARSSPDRIPDGAKRFICCSLLAHAFALVEYPILPLQTRVSRPTVVDDGNLTPADFEVASALEVVYPIDGIS